MTVFKTLMIAILLVCSWSIHATSQPMVDLARREPAHITLYFTDAVGDYGKSCKGISGGGIDVSIGSGLGGPEKCGKRGRISWKEGKNRQHSVDVTVTSTGNSYSVVVPSLYRDDFGAKDKSIDGMGAFWTWL